MTIYTGSRYEYASIDFVSTKEGSPAFPIVFYNSPYLTNVRYTEHTYKAGERIDQIAYRYYKDPKYWHTIMELNPEISDFNNIPVGTVLKIPNV